MDEQRACYGTKTDPAQHHECKLGLVADPKYINDSSVFSDLTWRMRGGLVGSGFGMPYRSTRQNWVKICRMQRRMSMDGSGVSLS